MKSRAIGNAVPSEAALKDAKTRLELSGQKHDHLQFMVFELIDLLNTYYVCISGGAVTDAGIEFSEFGKNNFEALQNLKTPFGKEKITFIGLSAGLGNFRQQIKKALKKLPNYSKVCLLIESSGDLEDVVVNDIGFTGELVEVYGVEK